ncbi:hypothetical protein LCGC14_2646460 [marine sediment metagenome]|uniref:Sulphotransferase Stf0 domain-containing protein n=1 Tax=marine sediment metagenome TaxID=412755 RepID=A0A0F8ZW35_9ZZZZ
MIIYSPRVGSTVLCECMAQAEVFGKVSAFYPGVGELLKTLFTPNADQWLKDHAHNGVHATKAPLNYFDEVVRFARPRPLCDFLKGCTQFITLFRHDTVAQAVSWHVAIETARFDSKAGSKKMDVPYDYWQILWFLAYVETMEHRAKLFTQSTGIPTMELYYEDIEHDFGAAVHRIAEWTGVAIDPDFQPEPTFKRQATSLNQELIDQFKAEQAQRSIEPVYFNG